MSRLTFKKDHEEGRNTGYGKVSRFENFDAITDMLGHYEDLGELEDLAKVIRCKNCIQFRKYPFADCGICLMQNSEVEPIYYCAKGKTKEVDNGQA